VSAKGDFLPVERSVRGRQTMADPSLLFQRRTLCSNVGPLLVLLDPCAHFTTIPVPKLSCKPVLYALADVLAD